MLCMLVIVEWVVIFDEAVFCGGMFGMGLRFFLMDRRLWVWWEMYFFDLVE